jgi:Na+-transporting NADH:ubiquinone oxidoreductase subunit C
MKQYLKLIFFVLILGSITSGLLVGMDLLTRDRIEANKEALIKSTILDAHGISYTFANIHEVFADTITIEEIDGLKFYINDATGYVSFEFLGGGVWGPIRGVLTLEDDFQTIVKIGILEQEETPGLGGIIAESRYLATFVGKLMVPSLEINKDSNPNKDNEVDAITGATRTSKAFELLINEAYTLHLAAWETR